MSRWESLGNTTSQLFFIQTDAVFVSLCLSTRQSEGDPDGGQLQHQDPHDERPCAQQEEGPEESSSTEEEAQQGVPGRG